MTIATCCQSKETTFLNLQDCDVQGPATEVEYHKNAADKQDQEIVNNEEQSIKPASGLVSITIKASGA